MLEKVYGLQDMVSNIVVYFNSNSVEYIFRRLLIDRFRVDSNYIVRAETVKQLKAFSNMIVSVPLLGERWLLIVDADKISLTDISPYLNRLYSTAVVVYELTGYRDYKKMVALQSFKQQMSTQYGADFYLGKLTEYSVDIIFNYYMVNKSDAERNRFGSKMMGYVKKNYLYNPDLVCELFGMVRDGNYPEKERDIIDMVGVGGNTPQAFTVGLLTTTTHTDKGITRFSAKNLRLLSDLSEKYEYGKIYGLIIDTLHGIVDIKVLQISGKYLDWYKEIPKTFDDKRVRRITRLRRFEDTILNKISLGRVLNLLYCMQKFRSFSKEEDLLEGLYLYASTIEQTMEEGKNA